MSSVWAMAVKPPEGMKGRDVLLKLAQPGDIAEPIDAGRWGWEPADHRMTVVSYDEAPDDRPDLTVILDIYAANARTCSLLADELAALLNTWPGCEAHANLPEFGQDPSMLLTA